jgi:hypothetical protein
MNLRRGITGKSAVLDPLVWVALADHAACRDDRDPFSHSVLAPPR